MMSNDDRTSTCDNPCKHSDTPLRPNLNGSNREAHIIVKHSRDCIFATIRSSMDKQ